MDEQVNEHGDAEPGEEATTRDPPALPIPRANLPGDGDRALEPLAQHDPGPHNIRSKSSSLGDSNTNAQQPTQTGDDAIDTLTNTIKPPTADTEVPALETTLPRVGSEATIKATIKASQQASREHTGDESKEASNEQPKQNDIVQPTARPASPTATEESRPPSEDEPNDGGESDRGGAMHSDSTQSTTPLWHSAPASRAVSKSSTHARPDASSSASGSSYVTADEPVGTPQRLATVAESELLPSSPGRNLDSPAHPSEPGGTTTSASSVRQNSTSSLLRSHQKDGPNSGVGPTHRRTQADNDAPLPNANNDPAVNKVSPAEGQFSSQQAGTDSGLVRFIHPSENVERERLVKVRLAQLRKRDTFKRLRRGKINDGEIIKMEKMLVRVDFTSHEMPNDFTENESEAIESRPIDKWKEFMCVCRESIDNESLFVLQLYKSRVIPAIEKTKVEKRWTHEVQLRPSNTKINLFSSLDKTMAIWHPTRTGTLLYTFNCKSGANSMEWYTFIRNVLGHSRTSALQVNVPDLDVNLRLDNPFGNLESVQDLEQAVEGDQEAIVRTMQEEQAAAANIIKRCMDILQQSPEWSAVVGQWNVAGRIGLAWKRYDRLEWVHGTNERKMYGTIGMEKSHELELRLKEHYPTIVADTSKEKLTEPPPVEGFLVRLTSQKGLEQRLGRFLYKRLYFSTHSQFLAFNRPARADPPPPPKMPMTNESQIPSATQIAETTPLIYSVNPFPVREDNGVAWLVDSNLTPSQRIEHDRDASDENERKVGLLLNCDGLINLCNVTRVRDVHRGAVPIDRNIDEGSDVDFDQDVSDTRRDDGTTADMDDKRTFELVLSNDLIIRLQAYDKTTKREWMLRLRALIKYWKLRTAADISLYKSVRAQNLSRLKLDEQAESLVGQFGRKWEVTGSFASPQLFHMCGITCCRTVHMAGMLYRKPRMHGVFKRNLAVLSHGRLLIFADALRGRDGAVIRHIHHARVASLNLRDCYIYSGRSTANDLLYQSTSFDRSRPGRHSLPRMYVDDGWSSIDEDTMTCFVLWHGKKSSWFKSQGAEDDGKSSRLKKVRALGTEGRSVVFKTRSRAERDHWVMSIGMEIERLAQGEDVRIEEQSRS